jgi:hypothetical protein
VVHSTAHHSTSVPSSTKSPGPVSAGKGGKGKK